MINTINLPPFKRMCVTIGNLPSSFMESMSYYEALEWLYNYIDKNIIPAINTEGEAITELQNAFTTLKNYVDNYFDNLDIQTEIDNKLDDMAESGELLEIISEYLNSNALICFNTVSDLKAADNLINGSYAKTMGYYSINDGGGATYIIKETSTDLYEDLDSGLVAELIHDKNINVKTIGAIADNETDNSTVFNKIINYVNNTDNNIYIPSGEYVIKNDLYGIKNGTTIFGDESGNGITENRTIIKDDRNTTNNYLFSFSNLSNSTLGTCVKNISFENISGAKCISVVSGGYKGCIKNCMFNGYIIAIYCNSVDFDIDTVNIFLCGDTVASSSNYAIMINNSTGVNINNITSDHTRYILKTDNDNVIKLTNSWLELSTYALVNGGSPIDISSGTIGIMSNNNFINLSTDEWNATTSAKPHMINTRNSRITISNNIFNCGAGSGDYTSEYSNKARFLNAVNAQIIGNTFYSVDYQNSITIDSNAKFSCNTVECKIPNDYTGQFQYIIYNANGSGNEDNTLIYNGTVTSAMYLPYLFYFYKKHNIISNIHNTNFFNATAADCVTYVFDSYARPVQIIGIEANTIGSNNIRYKGHINLGGSIAAVSTVYNNIASGYKIVITNTGTANKTYVQFLGTNLNNLSVKFDNVENYIGTIYEDTSITTEQSATNKLTITNV